MNEEISASIININPLKPQLIPQEIQQQQSQVKKKAKAKP